jgi:hypothetical protein
MSDQLRENLRQYENLSTSYSFLAATDWSGAGVQSLFPAKVGYTVYIVQITMAVLVDNAATQQFQDTTGTPVPVAKSKVSPGLGPIVWDFGPDGYKLPADQGFSHLMSAAGMAGAVSITAYRRKTINTP